MFITSQSKWLGFGWDFLINQVACLNSFAPVRVFITCKLGWLGFGWDSKKRPIKPVNTLFTDRRGRVFESRHSDFYLQEPEPLEIEGSGLFLFLLYPAFNQSHRHF